MCRSVTRRTGSGDLLEKAYQENKQLIAAYRTRMQNANKGRRNQDVVSKVENMLLLPVCYNLLNYNYTGLNRSLLG